MRLIALFAVAALFGAAAPAIGQTRHAEHADRGHMKHHGGATATPAPTALSEPGQGAFAALAEVVRLLEADPDTDWSRVDLSGLRAHLVDMDRLVTGAVVTETDLPDGIEAAATGGVETVASLRRMVPAHAAQLATDDRWRVAVEETENGVVLRVTSDEPEVAARIRGLGFFGLMAHQDHHRAHHLTLALGKDPHQH